MDLRRYMSAVRKFWWAILIPVILGTAFGAYSASKTEREYQGSVTFFVQTTGDASATAFAQGDQFAQRRVNSYVALLSSERLAKMVIATTDLKLTAKQLLPQLGASGDVNTVLLTATVTSPSKAEATVVTNAIAVQFPKLVDQVENDQTSTASVHLDVVSGPDVVRQPKGTVRQIGIRSALGLVVGLLLALVLELRDTTVHEEEELARLGIDPVLGRIPFDRTIRTSPLVLEAAPRSVRAEAFRQLRTNLQFMDVSKRTRTIVVTSSVAGEGKSVTAANLALTVAAADTRVLLIEADLRQPKTSEFFGLERTIGLSDAIAGRVDIDDVLQPWGDGGLVVLPSGHLPPNPSELLASDSAQELLETLSTRFDLVVIDTPPLVPVTDAAVAATLADGVVLVVRHGKTSRHQVARAIQSLETVNANILGSVLTMVPLGRDSSYASYIEGGVPDPETASSNWKPRRLARQAAVWMPVRPTTDAVASTDAAATATERVAPGPERVAPIRSAEAAPAGATPAKRRHATKKAPAKRSTAKAGATKKAPARRSAARNATRKTAPAKATPTKAAPTNGTHVNGTPVEPVAADPVPADSAPMNGVPVNGVPVNGVPVNEASPNGTPTEAAPSNGTPPVKGAAARTAALRNPPPEA